jgi:acyl-CoA reductase-like NAD-dependent aldehyde dehydrogenase
MVSKSPCLDFLVQGEVCSNGTRVFVQRGIYDEFLAEFVRQAQKMKIGDPLNSDTTVGATICKEHADKVLGYIAGAVEEGATVACGGKRVVLEGIFLQSRHDRVQSKHRKNSLFISIKMRRFS